MGLFDNIKDALTTDDAERLANARKQLEKSTADLEKARAKVGDDVNSFERGHLENLEREVERNRKIVDELSAKEAPAAPVDSPVTSEPVDNAPAAPDVVPTPEAPVETPAQPAPVEPAPVEPAPAPVEPATEMAAPAPAEPQYRTYTVKKGDTLSEIGQKFGVKWRDIASLNNIPNPDRIYPGQEFKIPNA